MTASTQSNLSNPSGLRPRGHAVLVKPYEDPRTKSSLIAIPDHVKATHLLLEQMATVIEVGGEAWRDEKQPRAAVGEVVLISQYAGHMATGPLDGEQYRMVNARDIFAVIEGKENRNG